MLIPRDASRLGPSRKRTSGVTDRRSPKILMNGEKRDTNGASASILKLKKVAL